MYKPTYFIHKNWYRMDNPTTHLGHREFTVDHAQPVLYLLAAKDKDEEVVYQYSFISSPWSHGVRP
jgi:hypothetical protein